MSAANSSPLLSSVIWRVVPRGGIDRAWVPGEIALVGGGYMWKRDYVVGPDCKGDPDRYLIVSEPAEYLATIHRSWLHTIESARERQEVFRDELTGKAMRAALDTIDALEVANRPEWWDQAVRAWCFETHLGMGPKWADENFGKDNMDQLRATISPNS